MLVLRAEAAKGRSPSRRSLTTMTKIARLLGTAALCLSAPAAIAADGELMVFDYAGFENPEFHSTYTAKHGSEPTFSFFGDEEEALQKILSGFKADVSGICAG